MIGANLPVWIAELAIHSCTFVWNQVRLFPCGPAGMYARREGLHTVGFYLKELR